MRLSLNDRELYKRIIVIAAPMIMQNLIQHFQILIDRAWLGKLNVEYLTALGNARILYMTMISFLWAASLGTTIIVAHRIGAKEFKTAGDYSHVSYLASSFIGGGIFLICFFGVSRIFALMGLEGQILEYSIRYIKILIFSLLFLGMELTTVSIFQGSGVTFPILIVGIIKNGLNIILDWILIFGNLGAPEMGLEGAALATTIANGTGTLVLFIFLLKSKKVPFKIEIPEIFKVPVKLYKDVFKIGFPAGIETVLWNLGQIVAIRILNSVDKMAAGYYTLVYGIQLIALFMYMGIANAGTTLVGQEWGAKEYNNGIHIGKECLKLIIFICALASFTFILFPWQIISLFTNDIPTIEKCIPLLYFTAVIAFFQALNIIAGSAIKGTGDTKWMLYSQILGTIMMISLSALFVFQFKMGVLGMFAAMLIDEFIRGFINWFRFITRKNPIKIFISFFTKKDVTIRE